MHSPIATQAPSQASWPAGQVHTPAAQLAPVGQVKPQPPQLVMSACTSMQTPLQETSPAVGQVQALFMHWPPWQTLLQAPQWLRLLAVSTQASPHKLCPAGHAQAPFTHSRPPGHMVPQVPQLSSSLIVSTQSIPHAVSPAAQLAAQPPWEQNGVADVQAMPQEPQLAALESTSTQAPSPQSWRPAWQAQAPAAHEEPAPHRVPHIPQLLASV
jgi:hypothetical protein